MSKKDKAKHRAKKDEKRARKAKKSPEALQAVSQTFAPGQAYSDGKPLDEVTYLEAKLILKPDRFTSVQAFRDFGKIVQKTAKASGVGFVADAEAGLRPQIREIVFGDTSDFRLYNNAFILRRRIPYVDGFPVGDPEIVFKFRHPNEKEATAMDVRPKIAGMYRIKFKAEALPLKDQVGGFRILYSHTCQFGLQAQMRSSRQDLDGYPCESIPGTCRCQEIRHRKDQPRQRRHRGGSAGAAWSA